MADNEAIVDRPIHHINRSLYIEGGIALTVFLTLLDCFANSRPSLQKEPVSKFSEYVRVELPFRQDFRHQPTQLSIVLLDQKSQMTADRFRGALAFWYWCTRQHQVDE